jgi:hypothetical protein
MLLRGRFIGVVLALVGLIFTIVGIALVATAGRTTVEGTVTGPCQSHVTGTAAGAPGRRRHVQQVCELTWTDAGSTHTASVTFDTQQALYPGTHRAIQVSGDSATQPSPTWVRVGTLILGVLLLAGGVLVFLRDGRGRERPGRPADANT